MYGPNDKAVVIQSEWYNGLYINGKIKDQGKPGYMNVETILRLLPNAELYYMSTEIYDEVLNGAGYPESLDELPLDQMEKIR
jgi:hypothetical protein